MDVGNGEWGAAASGRGRRAPQGQSKDEGVGIGDNGSSAGILFLRRGGLELLLLGPALAGPRPLSPCCGVLAQEGRRQVAGASRLAGLGMAKAKAKASGWWSIVRSQRRRRVLRDRRVRHKVKGRQCGKMVGHRVERKRAPVSAWTVKKASSPFMGGSPGPPPPSPTKPASIFSASSASLRAIRVRAMQPANRSPTPSRPECRSMNLGSLPLVAFLESASTLHAPHSASAPGQKTNTQRRDMGKSCQSWWPCL